VAENWRGPKISGWPKIHSKSYVSTGFISHIGAVAENLLFGLVYFLSGCSEKSFSACRKKVFLSERVEPATFGTNFRAKTGALAIMTVVSLNKSCGFKVPYKI
jgi:hypothetical protein